MLDAIALYCDAGFLSRFLLESDISTDTLY